VNCSNYLETQIILRRTSRVGARQAALGLMGIRLLRCPALWSRIDKNVFKKIAEIVIDNGYDDIWDEINEKILR
jgi:hypothetical protein